ncbi:MAG: alpha/beta fold hydrolase [Myxococcota bacterium]
MMEAHINSAPVGADLQSRHVAFASRRIFVNEAGSGYPVLMLHGGGPGANGLSNYGRNISPLAEHFRVLVPDMQGYGQSSKGLHRTDPFGDLADSMLGLMDALDVPRAHIVGNSLGGACALRMALERPDRVSALVLMGPGGVGTTRALPTKGLKLLFDYYEGDGPTLDKLRTFIREYLVYDSSSVPDELIRKRFEASLDPEVVAAPPLRRPRGIPNVRKIDFTRDPRVRRCSAPTLVLWGAEDRVNRPSGGEALRSRMPNCDLYLFSRTGHWVQWEREHEFNHATCAFLERHTPTH